MRLAIGCVGLLFGPLAVGQSVTVQNGNVIFIDAKGTALQVAHSGRDREPCLSPDGKQVIFVRDLGEVSGIGVPTVTESQLWVAPTTPNGTPKQLYRGPLTFPDGRPTSAFGSPKFSPDGRYVYFSSDYAATSHALNRLDLATGQVQFLSPAVEFDVLLRGRYKGFLIANIRTWSPPDSEGLQYPIYPFFLLTSAGKQYRRIAREEARLSDLVKAYSQ
jgi:hypothetical protein